MEGIMFGEIVWNGMDLIGLWFLLGLIISLASYMGFHVIKDKIKEWKLNRKK
jgi:hypothetical protein